MFEVEIYTDKHSNCPIEDYIKELNQKALTSKKEKIKLAKIVECVKMLQNYGTRAGLPYMKHIETQKTPKREIQKAKSNLIDFLERSE